jgi:dihydroflavonol-4-reductase
MQALVTGANGLIGANLVRELLRSGHSVRALVRLGSNLQSLAGLDVETVYGNVLHTDSLTEAAHGCDVVFHTAALFTYWDLNSEQLENLAIDGTLNVIDAAVKAGAGRIVFTSSSVVLGSSERPLVRNESHDLDENENAPYVIAKVLQERHAFEHAAAIGAELIAVCPTMTVGPYGYRLGPSNGLIVAYLDDVTRATFPGGCNIVAAKDIARGHIIAAEKGLAGERYLLGSENLTWAEIHKIISELCGIDGPLWKINHTASYLAATLYEIGAGLTGRTPMTTRVQARMVGRYYWYDHARIGALGYRPKPAREALAEAVAWLAASPHISRKTRSTMRLSGEVYKARKLMNALEPAVSK